VVGDDKAGIIFGLAALVENDLRFDNHAAWLLPGAGLITTLAEDLGALVSQLGQLPRAGQQGLGGALQDRVFGHAADICEARHTVEIGEHLRTGKAAIEAQLDSRLGKRRAHQVDQLVRAERDWVTFPVRIGSLRESEALGELLLREASLLTERVRMLARNS
jgi:hypothetical protein